MGITLEDLPSIPRGCLTLLPEDSERRRYLEDLLLERMALWGYREVVTPMFEYLDTMQEAVTEDLLKSAYKLTDRQTGRVMLLRPDITPQIARIAATSLKERRPLRLSYSLNVFRYDEQFGGSQREIHQLGCELIGVKTPEADAEVVALVVDLLNLAGVRDYRVVLSHMGFIGGILEGFRDPKSVQRVLRMKDLSAIGELKQRGEITESEADLLERVIFLFGDEEILREAEGIPLNSRSRDAVLQLREVNRFLGIHGVREQIVFDLSEAKGFQYHTGVVFEVIVDGVSRPIGFGGRYDRMMEYFGCDAPATGFSLDLAEVVALSTHRPEDKRSVYIVDFSSDKTSAVGLAKALRERGCCVGRDMVKRDFHESVRFAEEEGYKVVVEMREGSVKGVHPTRHCKEEDLQEIRLLLKEVS